MARACLRPERERVACAPAQQCCEGGCRGGCLGHQGAHQESQGQGDEVAQPRGELDSSQERRHVHAEKEQCQWDVQPRGELDSSQKRGRETMRHRGTTAGTDTVRDYGSGFGVYSAGSSSSPSCLISQSAAQPRGRHCPLWRRTGAGVKP